ncbi:MAG: 2-keto-4-pentenoate hydratase, partial [Woeseiaceae bacterium]|nr:2-keto-4-pentenoate hydratase [Woeseiaceae bacterium]
MTNKNNNLTDDTAELVDIAARFVNARRTATPLADYPGAIPENLAAAYRIQDIAIHEWDAPLGGWKVGRIPP